MLVCCHALPRSFFHHCFSLSPRLPLGGLYRKLRCGHTDFKTENGNGQSTGDQPGPTAGRPAAAPGAFTPAKTWARRYAHACRPLSPACQGSKWLPSALSQHRSRPARQKKRAPRYDRLWRRSCRHQPAAQSVQTVAGAARAEAQADEVSDGATGTRPLPRSLARRACRGSGSTLAQRDGAQQRSTQGTGLAVSPSPSPPPRWFILLGPATNLPSSVSFPSFLPQHVGRNFSRSSAASNPAIRGRLAADGGAAGHLCTASIHVCSAASNGASHLRTHGTTHAGAAAAAHCGAAGQQSGPHRRRPPEWAGSWAAAAAGTAAQRPVGSMPASSRRADAQLAQHAAGRRTLQPGQSVRRLDAWVCPERRRQQGWAARARVASVAVRCSCGKLPACGGAAAAAVHAPCGRPSLQQAGYASCHSKPMAYCLRLGRHRSAAVCPGRACPRQLARWRCSGRAVHTAALWCESMCPLVTHCCSQSSPA